jgi:hypothetical protein
MAVETTRVEGERGVLQVQTVHAVCLTTSLARELLRRQDWEKEGKGDLPASGQNGSISV